MGISDKDISAIDDFLKGNLSKNDQDYFDVRILQLEFQEELEMSKDLIACATTIGRKKRKAILLEHEKSLHIRSARTKGRYWILVLVLCILAILAWVFIRNGQKVKPTEAIFAELYEPYPNVVSPIQMGGGQEIYDVFQLYELGEYDSVISTLVKQRLKSSEEQFYLALSYLATGNWADCQQILETHIPADSRFHKASRWFLALSYVGDKKDKEGRIIMQEIAKDQNNAYTQKANDYLKR